MIPVEEALARILEEIPVLGSERIGLPDADGRVLSEAVVAPRDVPPWDNSSMDGYALPSAETRPASREAPVRLRILGEVPAGRLVAEPPVAAGAWRILTGAPLPPGADAVIPQEEVAVEAGELLVPRPVAAGENVRPRGEDVRAGETVLPAGTVLRPPAIGLLAALGRALVQVHQRPTVAILSTGDELVDLHETPGPGKIVNSNTYALAAQVREAGGVPLSLGIARDSREEIEERLTWGLRADLIVSSAGVSVGDRDFVKEVLTKLGAELRFWQVAMRPGKPLTFGSLGGRPFFGLPGNPVSSMVTFELFVRPALLKMGGHRRLFRPRVRARAAEALPNPGRRRGYLRVRLAWQEDGLEARLTGEQGSAVLRSMLLAQGLAVVPPETTIPPGGAVEVILLEPVA
ncbi:MAG: molybdopterin molybdotransferase MoeA [Candidatus Rokubacteria bacterium]|nr:molybdopterin molybdotransferase MoeA [Candidatus Rokubacteria bacterium]